MNDLLYKGHFKGLDIAFTYAVTTSAVNEAVVRHDCDQEGSHQNGPGLLRGHQSALPLNNPMSVFCGKGV